MLNRPLLLSSATIAASSSSSLRRLIDLSTTLSHLQQIHSHILTSPHLHLSSSLLSRLLFSSSTLPPSPSSLSYSSSLFSLLPSPSLSSFNALNRSLSLSLNPNPNPNPISLYSQMLRSSITPNHLTFPFLLKHSAHLRLLTTGQSLHSHVFKLGLDADIFVQNSLISLYSGFLRIDYARKVFDEMPYRDVVSENSLLVGFLRCGELDLALGLFRDMKGRRNVRSWNSVITGFVQGGRCREALEMFNEMLLLSSDDGKPDKITVASLLSACASLGALDQGKWVHGYLEREKSLKPDMVIATTLIDMYGKCGCVERAMEVFREMPKRDVLAWTAMISALAINGHGEAAFCLFDEMQKQGTKPNHVTLGALLTACAHSGMVEKGRWCFYSMKKIYSIEPQPQHYACMVDLLGRKGFFDEAEKLIESMPMESDSFVWGALLGACRIHGNVELGERVAGHLIELDPLNHAYYIVLSDIYASAKRFEEVKRIRFFMRDQGIKKTSPGCSLIEVDGQVHEFSVKGIKVEFLREIEWVLNGISGELKWIGYVPDDTVELLHFI